MGFVRSVQVTPLGLFYIYYPWFGNFGIVGVARSICVTSASWYWPKSSWFFCYPLSSVVILGHHHSACNDVHSAKVIMMLSQTFYRRRKPSSTDLLLYSDQERPLSHDRKTATTLENKHSTATVSMDSEPVMHFSSLRVVMMIGW